MSDMLACQCADEEMERRERLAYGRVLTDAEVIAFGERGEYLRGTAPSRRG